jgi:hypothetical protein
VVVVVVVVVVDGEVLAPGATVSALGATVVSTDDVVHGAGVPATVDKNNISVCLKCVCFPKTLHLFCA